MSRKKIVAGNWKMNKTLDEARSLAAEVTAAASGASAEVVLCVPFPFLLPVQGIVQGTAVKTGAQNCSEHESGAFTGEVSAAMIKSLQVPYVILGHSERRQFFGEDSALLARKTDRVLAHGLTPILCCGEPLEIRERGSHEQLVRSQVAEALFHLTAEQMANVVIAYEPVWAIGTGKTASAQQAQDMHAVIRKELAVKYGALAGSISILYGGSVKPDNAAELFSCPDVDGGLVGGASLKATDFAGIIKGMR